MSRHRRKIEHEEFLSAQIAHTQYAMNRSSDSPKLTMEHFMPSRAAERALQDCYDEDAALIAWATPPVPYSR